jgi:hypothetical protein
MNKYEKPTSQDLNKLTFSEGACASGTFVGTCSAIAGGLAGNCLGNGTSAGTCSGNGTTIHNTCTQGAFGTNTQCTTGGFATPPS